MKTVGAYLRAFRRGYTYDPRRNLYLWFGFLWGLPIPAFAFLLEAGGPGLLHGFFLLHPLLFALVFGAMGTVRHSLEEENARLIRRLSEEAATDALTGLPNRRELMRDIEAAARRARRTRAPFSVVMLDLNGFKEVNERDGHAAGDRVLAEVARALQGSLRDSDIVGRHGGDEFVLVIDGDADVARATVARAWQAAVAATGLSFESGVATFPAEGEGADRLLETADRRLAEAKRELYRGRVRRA